MESRDRKHDNSNDNSLEELYKFISGASNDGFRYVNYETGHIVISDKFKSLFCISEDEIATDAHVESKVYFDDRQLYIDKKQKILENRMTSFEFEYRINDGMVWISHTGSLRFDEQGKLIEKYSFYKDIT
ncbi:MAG: hypothetical protein K2N34_09520, partial [Lachnospiraceae bacterium]|nr:hypothetical protein [Lachnospiraceae bacterium]